MAKKSTLQAVKDKLTGKATPKEQTASQTPPSPVKVAPEIYVTGIKGKKSTAIDPDSAAGKLEKRLKAMGLNVKFEQAHHLNVTITRETDGHTTHISAQTGENLIQSEADFLYGRAVNELLGGV